MTIPFFTMTADDTTRANGVNAATRGMGTDEPSSVILRVSIDATAVVTPDVFCAAVQTLVDRLRDVSVVGAVLHFSPMSDTGSHRSTDCDASIALAAADNTVIDAATKAVIASAVDLAQDVLNNALPTQSALGIFETALASQVLLRQLETQGKPVVAVCEQALSDRCFALALCCHYRIGGKLASHCLADSAANVMPFGLIARSVHLAGMLPVAGWLAEGTLLTTASALEMGLFDAQCNDGADRERAVSVWMTAQLNMAFDTLTSKHTNGQPAAQPVTQPWDQKGFAVPGGGLYARAGNYQRLALLTAHAAAAQDARRAVRQAILACVAEVSLLKIDAAVKVESRRYALLTT